MTRAYEFDVQMSCGGCASAVKRSVASMQNVLSVDASVEKQKVNVTVADDVEFDLVRQAIEMSGKKVIEGRIIEDETDGKC
ncbi:heavy metal transporter (heavy-metal-associated domain protein) [Metarhizium robertsii]|uniref:Heavy metal transporter (Heavy-metal-associated domain protein) n=2 Tax=Metarhizium robertsii TaxID=568076 RepID=A0A014N7K1_9HYPO|nr:heavy metal transporter (heavy-metal-associated domain protein) [Metarhizium robertsii]